MTSLKRLAETAMAAKLLADAALMEGKAAREQLKPLLDQADTVTHRVRAADGAELGTISRTAGKHYARVVDERALMAWVRTHHPHQLVEIIQPAYRDLLLERAREDGVAVDRLTGVVIPGITVHEGNPGLRVLPNPVAKDRMRTLLARTGALPMAEPGTVPPTSDETGAADAEA